MLPAKAASAFCFLCFVVKDASVLVVGISNEEGQIIYGPRQIGSVGTGIPACDLIGGTCKKSGGNGFGLKYS